MYILFLILNMDPFTTDATESQVRALCEQYGTVTRIYMPTDRDTGGFRGYAFISMASRDERLKLSTALDQSSFLGRIIYSNDSLPKSNKKKKECKYR